MYTIQREGFITLLDFFCFILGFLFACFVFCMKGKGKGTDICQSELDKCSCKE